MKKIGAKIREYRLKRGISRKVLSDGICDESTLFRIEKGLHEPRVSTLIRLCDKLGIPIDLIFSSLESSEAKYIRRVKQIFRKHVDFEEISTLQSVLDRVEKKISSFDSNHIDSNRFIRWQQAILLHNKEINLLQVKQELEQLIPYKKQLISELDIEIAVTLGDLYLHLDQANCASEIFQLAYQAAKKLPVKKERTIYVQSGYNYAKTLFYLGSYDAAIKILEDLLLYNRMNHLFYLNGQLHQLMGDTFDKKGIYESAEGHLKKALSFYKADSKTDLYLRGLLNLVETQYKAGKEKELMSSLNRLEDQITHFNSDLEFLKQVRQVKDSIHITHSSANT